MNWKLAGGIVAFFLASGTLWTALGLAKVSDLSDHNQNGNAHQVILEPNTRPVPATHAMRKIYDAQKKHQDEYQELATKVDDGVDVIVTVRNGMYEDRAERLADRAADKIQNPRRSREVWKEVKEKALDNLARDRPIRDGLQRYLDYD